MLFILKLKCDDLCASRHSLSKFSENRMQENVGRPGQETKFYPLFLKRIKQLEILKSDNPFFHSEQ